MSHNYKPGDKIRFRYEKQKFTVKSVSDRFLICTKPFNLKKTVIYTIVDFERNVRGPNNLVFNMWDYTKQEDIDDCMASLLLPESDASRCEVSYRRQLELDIENS